MYNLPRWNQKEIDNLSKLITSSETEFVRKLPPKVPDQIASQGNSIKHRKKN